MILNSGLLFCPPCLLSDVHFFAVRRLVVGLLFATMTMGVESSFSAGPCLKWSTSFATTVNLFAICKVVAFRVTR